MRLSARAAQQERKRKVFDPRSEKEQSCAAGASAQTLALRTQSSDKALHRGLLMIPSGVAFSISNAWRSTAIHFFLVLAVLFGFSGALPAQTPAYVGSEACKDCHAGAYAAWTGSHHALAWTPPTAQHILGDFDDTSFSHRGVTTTFSNKGGTYYIETDGPDGTLTKYPVVGVAGIEPLQQYLLETEPGRLQSFDVAWDVGAERWYHLYPDQELFSGNGLHWTGPYKNWNARCAECHATGYKKNYTPLERVYRSTQAEIGVGCEACHGPGQAHLAWAGQSQSFDRDAWPDLSITGLTMDYSAGAEATIQQCASCHARREPFEDGNPLPGTPFHDAYRLSTLRPGLYHADGQILDEVYVYGSFLQSRMYARGVSCTNCHEAHTAELRIAGNGVCTQCHSTAGNPSFPTLRQSNYDDPQHHFHELGSSGAQCKSCHMIERTYMGIDGRRDHSFRVPRPDLSVTLQTPNACSDCHSEQTPSWAADQVAAWYPNGRHRESHPAEVFQPARRNAASETDSLIDIALYKELPGLVRASALDLLDQIGSVAVSDRVHHLLKDDDPVVRNAAVRVQRSAPAPIVVARLIPLLDDPSRSVRMSVARELLSVRQQGMPETARQSLGQAFGEWQSSLVAKSDFPETQIVIAGVGLVTRRFEAALEAFGEAKKMDPQHIDAWTMIARIHAAMGNRQLAIETLTQAMAVNPDEISLSLLRADLMQ